MNCWHSMPLVTPFRTLDYTLPSHGHCTFNNAVGFEPQPRHATPTASRSGRAGRGPHAGPPVEPLHWPPILKHHITFATTWPLGIILHLPFLGPCSSTANSAPAALPAV